MKPRITKKVAGNDVDVSVDESWKSICQVISRARLATAVNTTGEQDEKFKQVRLAFLAERLRDLEGLTLHEDE